MLTQSFVMLDRIGLRSEKRMWDNGIHCWNQFQEAKSIPGISKTRKGWCDRRLDQFQNALCKQDASFFAGHLPNSETWRLYQEFRDDAVFLDIETSGYYGDITVIGMYDGRETKTLVRGFNLDKELLKKILGHYKLILTFNGSSFDLPVIQRYFGGALPNMPHIDLRHVCSRIGLTGGLKKIEQLVGIKRPVGLEGVSGADAVFLWQNWRATGKREYLDLLVAYNEEDIVNLQPLADEAIPALWKKLRATACKSAESV